LITNLLQKKFSLDESIARLVSQDGLSFAQIATSTALHQLYHIANYSNAPKHHWTVRTRALNFYEDVIRPKFIAEIAQSKKTGKLSIVLDEWTSVANRRYLNVTVVSQTNTWNIGLQRILGSATSFNLRQLIVKKLESFELDLYEVGCLVTDGASVMTCLGHLVQPVKQQLCFAHAIQLAVIKVLYKKPITASANDFSEFSQDVDPDVTEENFENLDDFDAAIQDWDGSDDFNGDEISNGLELNDDFAVLISDVRTIVKQFGFSGKRNDVLQQYVMQTFKTERCLILDCKTRWNSLCDMLERFVELNKCVQMACIELGLEFKFSTSQIDVLTELVNSLKQIKSGVNFLCRENCNLLIADGVFSKMFKRLGRQNNSIANDLFSCLKTEFTKRRTILSDVLQYLQDPKKDSPVHKELQTLRPSKSEIGEFIKKFLQPAEPEEEESQQSEEEVDYDSDSSNDDFEKSVQLMIEKTMAPSTKISSKSTFNDNLKAFETNNQKSADLEFVYQSLLNIKPTSVQAERAFSAAGYLCNKYRSKMRDDTLNFLCVGRAFFQTQKKV
jgi:hypothetical protein